MLKTYENFIFENEIKGKFKTIDYKIVIKDLNDRSTTLVTDFKLIKSEDGKLEIEAKGYTYTNIDGFGWNGGKKKMGWIAFDNKKDNKTIIVRNKHFENGSKKIKIYQ